MSNDCDGFIVKLKKCNFEFARKITTFSHRTLIYAKTSVFIEVLEARKVEHSFCRFYNRFCPGIFFPCNQPRA